MSVWKKSRFSPVLLVPVVVLGVAAAGGWFLLSGFLDPYRTVAPLDIPAYVSSARSLRGNTYKLEGEVLDSLAWSPTGRLISVGIDDKKRVVPVLLPGRFSSFNIEKGQQFKFLLIVDEQGVLRAKKLARL